MAFFEFRSTGHMDCNQNSTAANKGKVCPSVSKMPESLNMKTASMDYELDISKSFSQLTTSPQNDEELQELNNNASEFQNAFEKPVIQIPHDDMESKEPIENEKEFEKEMMSIVKLVYEILGPDQREATYQKLLKIKISNRSIECEEEVEIPIMYDGNKIGSRRADLIVKLNDKTH
ncbi:hypothetical protein BBP00_00008968 [Phytophthora kernoviae]|uniref:Uncharacterized protein n=1 Tax=Phytophthora kernoviae TaxID=325452 RepID=A0A3F2RE91_9STRA|nr:hypothetical protein BBP00_00008968 [Phytophthora kernoviae]